MSKGPCGARSVTLSSTLLGSVTQPIAGALPLPAASTRAPDQGDLWGGLQVREAGLGHQRPRTPRSHPSPTPHPCRTTIWAHRVRFLEEQALPHWATFTIWNAGRQGRRLYRSLTAGSQRKVAAFCDVDENKIRKGFYCYEDSQERPKPRIPVLHFRAARPPFVICVKLDLTGGVFEDNLRSLNLQEGRDFLHFS
uniref:UDP-GlcNAc:betaGal beta-1,3-N-acetylglucosaminyltransferase like 1 n=1 Tax=Ovis aries TaxID=9940 RepID=A0AC11DNS2_SHEEP